MKKVLLAAAAASVLFAVSAPPAEAGISCKLIPQFCPKDPPGGGGGPGGGPVGVPEPATLALLGSGIAALGVAAFRRRSKKD